MISVAFLTSFDLLNDNVRCRLMHRGWPIYHIAANWAELELADFLMPFVIHDSFAVRRFNTRCKIVDIGLNLSIHRK